MLGTAKNLIKTGLFVAFLLLLLPASNIIAEDFSSIKDKFSLTYDPSLAPTSVELYNVGLALKSKIANFPSFNVVIESGFADLNAEKSEKEKAFLDSYRLVGIKEPEMIYSKDMIINGRRAFNAELRYALDGVILRSNVSLLTASDRHFILTYIDTEEGYPKSKQLADSILSSFKILDDSPPYLAALENGSGSDLWLALLAVALAAALLIMKFIHRK